MALYDDYNTDPDLNTAPAPKGAPTGVYPGTSVAQTFRSVMAAIKELAGAAASLTGAAFTGAVTIGTTDANADLTVNGNASVGGTLTVTGGTALKDTLTVGTTTAPKSTVLNGIMTVTGSGSFGAALNVAGDTTLTGQVAFQRIGKNIVTLNNDIGSAASAAATANSNATSAMARANAAATAVQCTPFGLYEIGPIGEGTYMGIGPSDGRYMRDIRITTTGDSTTYYAIIGGIQKPGV